MQPKVSEGLKKFESALNEYIKPATYPLAIKMLKSEKEISSGVKRPKRDLQPMTPCQAFSISRMQGIPIAMLKEDFSLSCSTSYIVFGLIKPPKWWLEGNLAYKVWALSKKAGANMEKNVSRFPLNKYVGFVVAPISKANFDPDVVALYCDPAQATLLINGVRAKDGSRFCTCISARNACSDMVVETMQTGQP